ncbi:MAG: pitrilysin family protein [Vicinamibacterales bacterium]
MTITTAGSGLAPARAVLSNGAVVIAQETSMTPAVTISAVFRAGSMYEPKELAGLSYLTGRVMDRGTERRTAAMIAQELDDRGVSLKISTNRHNLALSTTCLAEDFDEVLDIVLDVARSPVFPEEEIVKRRAEAVTAVRQDQDNPAVLAVQGLMALLYGDLHPYGRPVKGTAEILERISRRDIVRFHGSRVGPSSLTLVIAGDVRGQQAIEGSRAQLEEWQTAAIPRTELPAVPSTGPRRERSIVMSGKAQSDIAYGFTTIPRLDPRYYAYWMMNNILGQFGLGGRLADNVRERQGMAYYTYSSFDPAPAQAPLIIRAGVDPANVRRAIAAIDHEVDSLGADGPTEQELAETRDFLVGSIPRLLETNQSIATFLQLAEEFQLGLDFDRRLPGLLRQVTLEEVRAAAREALQTSRASVVVAGPQETFV